MRMALAICIAAFLAGAPLLHILADSEISRANAANADNLRLIASRLDDIMYSLEKQSLLLAEGRNMQGILTKDLFSQDIQSSINLFNEIRLYKNNSDFAEDIFFYNSSMSGIFSNRYGYLDAGSELHAGIVYLTGLERPSGWYQPTQTGSGDYIGFYRKLLRFPDSDPQGILVFYVSKQALLPYLSGGAGSMGGISFVLDGDNDILLSSDSFVAEHSELEAALAGAVPDDMPVEEPLISTIQLNGKAYLAAGIKKFSGKTYYSIIERGQVRNQVERVFVTMLLSMAIAIAVGVLYAVMNARKLYSPVKALFLKSRELGVPIPTHNHEILYISECVDALNEQTRTLRQYTIEARSKLREGFLAQLLGGPLPQGEARELLAEHRDDGLPASCRYAVIVFHSGGELSVERLREHVGSLDVEAPFSMDRIVAKKNSLAVIGCFPPGAAEEEILEECRVFAGEAAGAFPQPARVGIGTVQPLGGLSSSYRDAILSAAEYPAGREDACPHEKNPPEGLHFVHSFAARLVAEAAQGNADALKGELLLFVQAVVQTDCGNYAFQMFKMLLADMLFLLDSQSAGQAAELLERELFYSLNDCLSVGEAKDWFEQVLFPALIEQSCRAKRQEHAVSRVCQYIQDNVRGDITLTDCAEHAGLSPSYLSKLFKKETGVSFLDYVLERKIEEVKNLLLGTDLKISEIADMIGYSPRSLYRQFVKLTAQSPNEFRKEAERKAM